MWNVREITVDIYPIKRATARVKYRLIPVRDLPEDWKCPVCGQEKFLRSGRITLADLIHRPPLNRAAF